MNIGEQSDILPPLSPKLRSGGFLFDSPYGLSISKLSPRAPRFILISPDTGISSIFCNTTTDLLSVCAVYAVDSILFPSSRMFTAAFTSRSIWFPHSQWYIRSLRPSSSLTLPHTLHFLLDGKYRSTFTSFFPCLLSL